MSVGCSSRSRQFQGGSRQPAHATMVHTTISTGIYSVLKYYHGTRVLSTYYQTSSTKAIITGIISTCNLMYVQAAPKSHDVRCVGGPRVLEYVLVRTYSSTYTCTYVYGTRTRVRTPVHTRTCTYVLHHWYSSTMVSFNTGSCTVVRSCVPVIIISVSQQPTTINECSLLHSFLFPVASGRAPSAPWSTAVSNKQNSDF